LTAIALEGHYRASCAVVTLDAATASALLTTNCSLDPGQPLTPAGSHPAIILLGTHTAVRFKAFPLIRVNYAEALVAVPWVLPTGSADASPAAQVSRLWLNRLLPVIGGWFFGFPKTWNRIEERPERYRVSGQLSRKALIDAQFRVSGGPASPSSFPHFAEVRPIFEQIFVQRFLLFGPACYLRMDFHLEEATLQPIEASVEIPRPSRGGLPPGGYEVPPITTRPLGAFRLELPWTLTWPSRQR
jgi:hypothetical protein